MTYNVSSGTLNTTMPTILTCPAALWLFTAGSVTVRPIPENYAFQATDKWTDGGYHRVKRSLLWRGLISTGTKTYFISLRAAMTKHWNEMSLTVWEIWASAWWSSVLIAALYLYYWWRLAGNRAVLGWESERASQRTAGKDCSHWQHAHMDKGKHSCCYAAIFLPLLSIFWYSCYCFVF